MTSDYSYDPADRVDRIDHGGPGGVIDFYDYGYDPAGNRTSMTSAAGVETYTINLINQLTGVAYPDGTSTDYSYDPAGNRLTETTAGTTISYVYDDASRLASIDGVGNSYDGAGNLLFDGTNTYGWDWQSRLTTADEGMTSTSYGYDGDHVRVTVDGQARLYDRQGWTGLPELVSTGTTAFTHSPEGVINQIGAITEGLLADGLGSIRGVTDPAGTVTESSTYDVFGEALTQSGTASRFGFTGAQQADELIYLNARYLTPDVGRFLSVDPIRPGASGVTGYNPYTYVINNPATSTDPSGLASGPSYAATLQPSLIAREAIRRIAQDALRAVFLTAAACLAVYGTTTLVGVGGQGTCVADPPQTDENAPGGGEGSDLWKKIVAGVVAGSLALAQISNEVLNDDHLGVITTYREVDGRKTGSGSKITRPDFRAKDLQFNPGLSTFERDSLTGNMGLELRCF